MFFYVIGILVGLVISAAVFWLAGRFSSEPPNIVQSFIGAIIIEVIALIFHRLGLLGYFIVFIATWVVITKIGRMDAATGFFGALMYVALQFLIFFLLATSGI